MSTVVLSNETPPEQTAPKRIHVIKRNKGWAILKEISDRVLKVFDEKSEAIKEAKDYLKSGNDVIIHQENGRVEKWIKAEE
ncbi:MAG: DUF2188 domain-containing protein [Sphingobacteriales bacterium]|nr:DUF2188 domain-containing protein [Sphingobacteriales bacterium]